MKLIVTVNNEKERRQSNLNYKNIRMQVYELCGIIKYFKIIMTTVNWQLTGHFGLKGFNFVVMLAVVCNIVQACFECRLFLGWGGFCSVLVKHFIVSMAVHRNTSPGLCKKQGSVNIFHLDTSCYSAVDVA